MASVSWIHRRGGSFLPYHRVPVTWAGGMDHPGSSSPLGRYDCLTMITPAVARCQVLAESLTWISSQASPSKSQVEIPVLPIFQMKQLRLREGEVSGRLGSELATRQPWTLSLGLPHWAQQLCSWPAWFLI